MMARRATTTIATLLVAVWATTAAADAKSRQTPLSFSQLEGWAQDDHAQALAAFRVSCARASNLAGACARAATVRAGAARSFFEQEFTPQLVEENGFLTGYFEPELSGSSVQDARHQAPALSMPTGSQSNLPDRTAIEEGALAGRSKALLYMDPIDLFVTQIQGSARIRLTDGRVVRLGYAGRNGKPYTAVGKVLVDRGIMRLEDVTMDRIIAWMRTNPAASRELIRQNKSYVFFRIDETLSQASGPVGGAGVPLTAGRSLAIDRKAWSYGLPVWVESDLSDGQLRRLVVAQDTGTAIVGAARADLFVGTGEQAGLQAGRIRHPMRMIVLVPRT
jgi:membrane-bound lytic murein transglycosylase A